MGSICPQPREKARLFSWKDKCVANRLNASQECRVPDLSGEHIQAHVTAALAEDIGEGDATTNALVDAQRRCQGHIVAREPLTFCGRNLIETVFQRLDTEAVITHLHSDGDEVPAGATLVTLDASARALLTGERTALNYAQRLSGVATQAARYVAAVKDSGVLLLDTRKTTPGWRDLEKYAVQCGGARNHRHGLDDMVMIKDNHLAALEGNNRISSAIERCRDAHPDLKIEVEADTPIQARQAAESGADIILLDNMTLDELRESVALIDNRSQIEASGGVTLDTIRDIAQTGVHYISVGALTHSAISVDIALDFSL